MSNKFPNLLIFATHIGTSWLSNDFAIKTVKMLLLTGQLVLHYLKLFLFFSEDTEV